VEKVQSMDVIVHLRTGRIVVVILILSTIVCGIRRDIAVERDRLLKKMLLFQMDKVQSMGLICHFQIGRIVRRTAMIHYITLGGETTVDVALTTIVVDVTLSLIVGGSTTVDVALTKIIVDVTLSTIVGGSTTVDVALTKIVVDVTLSTIVGGSTIALTKIVVDVTFSTIVGGKTTVDVALTTIVVDVTRSTIVCSLTTVEVATTTIVEIVILTMPRHLR
jgi:hypothetical protein